MGTTNKTKSEFAEEIASKQELIDYFKWKSKTPPWNRNPARINKAIKELFAEMVELEQQLDQIN